MKVGIGLFMLLMSCGLLAETVEETFEESMEIMQKDACSAKQKELENSLLQMAGECDPTKYMVTEGLHFSNSFCSKEGGHHVVATAMQSLYPQKGCFIVAASLGNNSPLGWLPSENGYSKEQSSVIFDGERPMECNDFTVYLSLFFLSSNQEVLLTEETQIVTGDSNAIAFAHMFIDVLFPYELPGKLERCVFK